MRFNYSSQSIADPVILITGQENNCHQIAVIDHLLCIVDTPNQVIRRFTLEGDAVDVRAPIPVAQPDDRTGAYRHMNSIAPIGETIGLLLHNSAAGQHRPSEFLRLDMDWRVIERRELAGRGCHDILQRDGGELLFCGSLDGELVDLAGERTAVCRHMTRGLAQRGGTIMVGATPLRDRARRDDPEGWLHFLDQDLRHLGVIETPGGPTYILAL